VRLSLPIVRMTRMRYVYPILALFGVFAAFFVVGMAIGAVMDVVEWWRLR
jgi:hypothetical protein